MKLKAFTEKAVFTRAVQPQHQIDEPEERALAWFCASALSCMGVSIAGMSLASLQTAATGKTLATCLADVSVSACQQDCMQFTAEVHSFRPNKTYNHQRDQNSLQ